MHYNALWYFLIHSDTYFKDNLYFFGQERKLLIPFRTGEFWIVPIDVNFLNVDEKVESFLSRDPIVDTRKIKVFGDGDSAETEAETESEPPKQALQISEVLHAQSLDKFLNRLVAFVRVEGDDRIFFVHADINEFDESVKMVKVWTF